MKEFPVASTNCRTRRTCWGEIAPARLPVSGSMWWKWWVNRTGQLPVVDEVDESVWAIGGFNGHGMPFGAIVADLVADWIHTATRPPALAPLALDRLVPTP